MSSSRANEEKRPSGEEIEELRLRIDEIDLQLVDLLNKRTKAALEIGRRKQAEGEEPYVPAREREVLEKVLAANRGPLSRDALLAIYREIMSAALSVEKRIVIAYLGPQATFTHMAARSRFGENVTYRPFESIAEVFAAVEQGRADYGVVPIENSIEGAVSHTLDEFVETDLKICAEIYLSISHHLLAGDPSREVVKVYSNPQVFGQCRHWLLEHMPGVELVPVSSTARAAELAAREPGSAAIAGRLAGELYGLKILEENIQDELGNTTRFLVIGRQFSGPSGRDKTSILFGVKDKVGALHEALGPFKRYNINMTKIESRPNRCKAWEYFFFVDIEGHADEESVQNALREMGSHCTILKVLGSYPKAHLEPADSHGS
ncbi:MAG TPA: prephenate dehydratase [Kiritimatiellae bacterium]|nr:prephenate dehydratase [Kiritimatiellia bacterium]